METKAATTDQARQALEAIANVPISISLEHWSVLSGTILSALAGADAALSVQKQLVEALEWYADQFCEFGTSNTGCGKYGDDTCSGCKARAAIQAAKASS